MSHDDDPLALAPLFTGGGEPWLPILKPVIERLSDADLFVGPARGKAVVPVRELTFQALKPNPPERWKVVVFGQNPYPRVESATGIAMFDNTFTEWADSQFGKVTSIRCIVKAACMWKHGVEKKTSTASIRTLLAREKVVQPPEWFQAVLTQGVLLLNAALTASSDGSTSTAQHTAFWKPVIEAIVEEILRAKQASAEPSERGVVFAWWGNHAKQLRKLVERLATKYPGVAVRHVDHCNPAAMGDAFCDGEHFAMVNAALDDLGAGAIDWLPSVGWNASIAAADTSTRMGEFISQTMEAHKLYLDRLQGVGDEKLEDLPAISGILATAKMTLGDAMAPLVGLAPGLRYVVEQARAFARARVESGAAGHLDEHEIAALYLYTTESVLYRRLNAALRAPNRAAVTPYFAYLRLFFEALAKLDAFEGSLYRGVALDLRTRYPRGRTITWWGVSSCTPKLAVARAFLGGGGRRTLFEVTARSAVSIRRFSAFSGEDEYVLAPGTQLEVVGVTNEPGGLTRIALSELAVDRLVA